MQHGTDASLRWAIYDAQASDTHHATCSLHHTTPPGTCDRKLTGGVARHDDDATLHSARSAPRRMQRATSAACPAAPRFVQPRDGPTTSPWRRATYHVARRHAGGRRATWRTSSARRPTPKRSRLRSYVRHVAHGIDGATYTRHAQRIVPAPYVSLCLAQKRASRACTPPIMGPVAHRIPRDSGARVAWCPMRPSGMMPMLMPSCLFGIVCTRRVAPSA